MPHLVQPSKSPWKRPATAPGADQRPAWARSAACDSARSEAGRASPAILRLDRPKPCGWQWPDVQDATLITVGDKRHPAG